MDYKKFVEDLKKQLNLTSDEALSRVLEISCATIRSWKYGVKKPSDISMDKIKKKLKQLKK